MSSLFISCGGTLKYTSLLTEFMRSHNLYNNDSLIFLTFYEISPPLPIHHYYLPSKVDLQISPREWNTLLYDKLSEIIKTFSIDTFIFEGHFVYSGIIQVMKLQPSSTYIWLKPPSATPSSNKREKYFDKVITLSPSLEELISLAPLLGSSTNS